MIRLLSYSLRWEDYSFLFLKVERLYHFSIYQDGITVLNIP